jgi:EAL domain-containing protein (putative c-di-GMP-specific phosphodiesterase class I)
VIAEGVEQQGELKVLEYLTCDAAQVYLFSKSMKEELARVLARESMPTPKL